MSRVLLIARRSRIQEVRPDFSIPIKLTLVVAGGYRVPGFFENKAPGGGAYRSPLGTIVCLSICDWERCEVRVKVKGSLRYSVISFFVLCRYTYKALIVFLARYSGRLAPLYVRLTLKLPDESKWAVANFFISQLLQM